MNTKNKSNGFQGFGMYFLLIAAVILIWYGVAGNRQNNSYTRAEFEQALIDREVAEVTVIQNREIPTGSAKIVFKDGTKETLYTSDVNAIQELMDAQDFDSYTCEDVPE